MAISRLIAGLDIGSSKVACFIARISGEGALQITGIGNHKSAGIRSGAVTDMEKTRASIAAALDSAEKMAGVKLNDVVIGLSGGQLHSHVLRRDMNIGGNPVREADKTRLLNECMAAAHIPGHTLLHALPMGYAIDGARDVADPVNMHGHRLSLEMHVTSVRTPGFLNLAECVGNCHIDIRAAMANGYAAGLAVLLEEERQLGATVLDMGGGCVSIGVFQGGSLVSASSIPVGGRHVTMDVARGLSVSFEVAERLKTRHGSALASTADDRQMLDAAQIGEDGEGPSRIPKHCLLAITAPRIEETLELIRARLKEADTGLAGRRIVLTGGACQLPGLRERAAEILGRPVRIGHPGQTPATRDISGIGEFASAPACSAAAGLLLLAAETGARGVLHRASRPASGSRWGGLAAWLRETF